MPYLQYSSKEDPLRSCMSDPHIIIIIPLATKITKSRLLLLLSVAGIQQERNVDHLVAKQQIGRRLTKADLREAGVKAIGLPLETRVHE